MEERKDLTSQLEHLKISLSSKVSRDPHTLLTYLIIYNKAKRECYIDYMKGAKALYSFLVQGVGYLDLGEDKYPQISDPTFKVPILLSGYESVELAKIISSEDVHKGMRAIFLNMLGEIQRS